MFHNEQTLMFCIDQMDDLMDNCDSDEEKYDIGNLPPASVDIFGVFNRASLSAPLPDDDEENDYEKAVKKLTAKQRTPIEVVNMEMGWEEIEVLDADSWKAEMSKTWGMTDVEKEMKGSILNGIEQQHSVPKFTDKQAAQMRKIENDKSKGSGWFNMPATEVSDELRQDLEVIQMRSALDPTRFYKKNDLKTLPKYFQVGTVLPSPLERNEPGVRPSKKMSLTDELLKDAEFQQFNKRKYQEVMAEKNKTGYKTQHSKKPKWN